MMHTVLRTPGDWFRYVLTSAAFFTLLVLVPVFTTPGDDVGFQLSITPSWVLVGMTLLSLGNGLLVMMQWHIARVRRSLRGRDVAVQGGLLMGAIAATLGCAACYSSLASVIGLTGVAFLAEYRGWIMAGAALLLGVALYFTSRRVAGVCTRCDRFRPH